MDTNMSEVGVFPYAFTPPVVNSDLARSFGVEAPSPGTSGPRKQREADNRIICQKG